MVKLIEDLMVGGFILFIGIVGIIVFLSERKRICEQRKYKRGVGGKQNI